MTSILLIVTGYISYRAFNDPSFLDKLKHYPYAEKTRGEWYRLLTCGFVHGNWTHLLINMFVLWTFGEYVEQQIRILFPATGMWIYLGIYLAVIVLANIPTSFREQDNPYYAAVGASGAISGLVFIFILFNPWAKLYLYFILPIPGIVAGILYLVYSVWASKNSRDGIDHYAHFYGAIWGVILMILIQPEVLNQFIIRLLN